MFKLAGFSEDLDSSALYLILGQVSVTRYMF